ncbi:hypothetical protein MVES1_002285 [Malassezia vespertilionis]|nr:uncharacterized protein MVES1_002285 [Malassezia vespertilionis]WFD06930.1 hypothetical protein MVES1_002285 [Malassezia vespertilionis]
MSKVPLIVQAVSVPSDILNEAHRQGIIELRVWNPPKQHGTMGADRAWVKENLPGAAGFLCIPQVPVDEEVLDWAGPSLKVVSTISVGVDHIDLASCAKRGIKIGHTPSVLNDAVADTALLLAMMVSRHIMKAHAMVRKGEWGTTPTNVQSFVGPEMTGKTIGFLGFGEIGQMIARRLLSFAPKRILYTTSSPKPLDLQNKAFSTLAQDPFLQCIEKCGCAWPIEMANEPDRAALAEKSDFLFIIASLNSNTKHLVDKAFLNKMQPHAILVNVSRGPLVDTNALIDVLKNGKIGGAGLDVIEGEPQIPADHPALDEDLMDRLVLLPHLGSATDEARSAMIDYSIHNLLGALGLPAKGRTVEMPAELPL